MADEKNPEQPRKEPQKQAEPARSQGGASSRSGASADQPEQALATEKPVPSRPGKDTTQYVVTVDNRTGFALRIERLDEESGERQEVPLTAFAQASVQAGAPDYSALLAYYQGYADYLKVLMQGR
jgi:hypothetical protein